MERESEDGEGEREGKRENRFKIGTHLLGILAWPEKSKATFCSSMLHLHSSWPDLRQEV